MADDVQVSETFFDGKKRPSGKWMILMVGMVLMAGVMATVAFSLNHDKKSEGSAGVLAIKPTKKDIEVGGTATPEYNKAVVEQATNLAAEAEKRGQSFAPSPINGETVDALRVKKSEPPKRPKKDDQQDAQSIAAAKTAINKMLAGIMVGMELEPQKVENYKDQKLKEVATTTSTTATTGDARVTPLPAKPSLPGNTHIGSILYAANDLRLNSDGKNNVVRATVLSGPLKDYVALGGFEKSEETLSIAFSRLIAPSGVEYLIKGYAIDPTIAEANIASDVDHHYISRWGGFAAASFLTGFADATRLSGTSSGQLPDNNNQIQNFGMVTIPTYSLMEKGVIALGEVGRGVAGELREGVRRPPTVTLESGIPMGILIVGIGNTADK